MATVSVRYIVHDMFAMLNRGDLRLVLSVPGAPAGGGQAMPDGTLPQPGGWNRVGGKQIIAEDPSGNPVELFEPTLPEARLQ